MTDQEVTFSAKETAVPKMTKEDYMILLLEELVRAGQMKEGRIERMMAWEGDLLTLTGTIIQADFPFDSWTIYFRAEANATLRVWPGGTPPSSGAIEIRNGTAAHVKRTASQMNLQNIGSATCHYFVIALSLAEVSFDSLA